MEQQHSAHAGGKDPGQGPEREQGQAKKPARRQRRNQRGSKPRAAAAAAAPVSNPAAAAGTATGTASAAPGYAPGSAGSRSGAEPAGLPSDGGSASSAPREPRKRVGALRQEAAALYQAQLRFPLVPAPVMAAFSWLPRARLTALGSGVLGVLVMLGAGAACRWLLDGSSTVYGCAFLAASVACAAWVRPTDLIAGPVGMPLAFVAGLFFIGGGSGRQGLAERLTNLFPVLALNAAWLYAGTLVAALIVAVRKIALMVQQARVRALMEAEDAEEEAAEAEGR